MKLPIPACVSRLAALLACLCVPVGALGDPAFVGSEELLAGLPLEVVSAPISLVIAGRPAVLQIVRGTEGAQALASAALNTWARQGALVRGDEDGPWHKVSRVGRQGIEVLQLRDLAPRASDGYLVAWRLDETLPGAVAPGLDLVRPLLPRSAIVLSDVSSSAVSPGRTVVAWLAMGVDEADRLMLMRAKEMDLEQHKELDRNMPGRGDERARFFRNGRSELALTLHRKGAGTALVIHLMETIR